jgi:hypothetical protein
MALVIDWDRHLASKGSRWRRYVGGLMLPCVVFSVLAPRGGDNSNEAIIAKIGAGALLAVFFGTAFYIAFEVGERKKRLLKRLAILVPLLWLCSLIGYTMYIYLSE